MSKHTCEHAHACTRSSLQSGRGAYLAANVHNWHKAGVACKEFACASWAHHTHTQLGGLTAKRSRCLPSLRVCTRKGSTPGWRAVRLRLHAMHTAVAHTAHGPHRKALAVLALAAYVHEEGQHAWVARHEGAYARWTQQDTFAHQALVACCTGAHKLLQAALHQTCLRPVPLQAWRGQVR